MGGLLRFNSLIVFLVGFLPAACGGLLDDGVVTECVLPQDQLGTLQGKWPVTPVPLALQAGAFNQTEKALITEAVASWNIFFGNSLGIEVLNPQEDSNINAPADACTASLLTNDQFNNPVVIYKNASWNTIDPSVVALTTLCPSPDRPIRRLFSASMELNYRYFFVEGRPNPDLQATLLHELGHLLGLGHSCEPGLSSEQEQETLVPSCDNPSISQGYLDAVMFPSVNLTQSGSGNTKRILRENDMGRANCLYTDFD